MSRHCNLVGLLLEVLLMKIHLFDLSKLNSYCTKYISFSILTECTDSSTHVPEHVTPCITIPV